MHSFNSELRRVGALFLFGIVAMAFGYVGYIFGQWYVGLIDMLALKKIWVAVVMVISTLFYISTLFLVWFIENKLIWNAVLKEFRDRRSKFSIEAPISIGLGGGWLAALT